MKFTWEWILPVAFNFLALLIDKQDFAKASEENENLEEFISLNQPELLCRDRKYADSAKKEKTFALVFIWSIEDSAGQRIEPRDPFTISHRTRENGTITKNHPERWQRNNPKFELVRKNYLDVEVKILVTTELDNNLTLNAESNWTKLLSSDASPPRVSRLYHEEKVDENGAIVEEFHWSPTPEKLCSYILNIKSIDSDGVESQFKKIEIDVFEQESFQYKWNGASPLNKYRVQLRSVLDDWQNFNKKAPSVEFLAGCKTIYQYNYTLCVPPAPTNFSITRYNFLNSTATMAIEWKPPPDSDQILSYTIKWAKTPPTHEMPYQTPHTNLTSISSNMTQLVVGGLHVNTIYKVYIYCNSVGGTSLPLVKKITITDFAVFLSPKSAQIGGEANNYTVYVKNNATIIEEEKGEFWNYEMILLLTSICIIPFVTAVIAGLVFKNYLKKSSKKRDLVRMRVYPNKGGQPAMGNNGPGNLHSPTFRETLLQSKVPDSPLLTTPNQLNLRTNFNFLITKDEYEIDFYQLNFENVVGQGAFGKVMKAKLRTNQGRIKVVAVKMLKETALYEDKENLLKEIALVKRLGTHKNIAGIVACHTLNMPICLVLDYCSSGDLRIFLKNIREQHFRMQTEILENQKFLRKQNSYIIEEDEGNSDNKEDHKKNMNSNKLPSVMENQATSVNNIQEHEYSKTLISGNLIFDTKEFKTLKSTDLMSFARQIAIGMEYLAEKKIVHRDLAARNILVCRDGIVKISDFGMARSIEESNEYRKLTGGRLPLKWMSTEAIFDQVYSVKSDVWSFGIVLWELVTLGGSPYPGIPNRKLLKMIKAGYRMEKPENCSSELYSIMLSCWLVNPEERPLFSELRVKLENLLESSLCYIDLCAENYYHYKVPLNLYSAQRCEDSDSEAGIICESSSAESGRASTEGETDILLGVEEGAAAGLASFDTTNTGVEARSHDDDDEVSLTCTSGIGMSPAGVDVETDELTGLLGVGGQKFERPSEKIVCKEEKRNATSPACTYHVTQSSIV